VTGSVWVVKIALSSANSATDVLGVVGWSAEKMLYKIGDNITPCGTPARIVDSSDNAIIDNLNWRYNVIII